MTETIVPLRASGPAVFRVHPLPDFLADHTLLSADLPGRLEEHARRWVQVVRSLWAWQGAVFTLRFRAVPERGLLLVTVRGVAASAADQRQLDFDLGMRLRDFGIPADWLDDEPPPLEAHPKASVYTVRQREESGVWRGNVNAIPNSNQLLLNGLSLPPQTVAAPPVVFPWRGPGGTFLLPVKALLSLGEQAEVSVYLSPTKLSPIEAEFLRVAAAESDAKGRATAAVHGEAQISFADPAAAFAARVYLSQFRQLANPFLVCVRCAAGSRPAAVSLAATIEAVVLEPPLEPAVDPEEARLPPGADKFGPQPEARPPFAFPTGSHPLARLPYLADAAGAATVFRLPVSVNGGVPGIDTRQRVPDFHPGPRVDKAGPDEIDLGSFADGGRATMPLKNLTQHALVTGFTGSGKTVTVLRLLHQLWADHKTPFLVLESAKQEYRGLLTVPAFRAALRVYTLGNETAVPFRLNPFELRAGVRVEAHVGRLQVCFEGAIPPVGPSASVLAEALVEVYRVRGWSITDTCPKEPPKRAFPTLSDFIGVVERVIEDRKYAGEVKSNVTAAIVGRLRPLLLGSKGRMFDCQRSEPPAAELFARPTVLEMNDLNADDKALVVMFLLTVLREHREIEARERGVPGKLVHVCVVEEAHNVLAAVQSAGSGEGAGADTKFKAVEAFCSLLTEVRSLGQGLLIADQSPEKLASDALRNTNLQIAHQLRDGHDRAAVANAMIMTVEQRDYLGKLPAGMAAVFRTGLERATFVTVPPYYPLPDLPPPVAADGTGFSRVLADGPVVAHMEAVVPRVKDLRRPERPFAGCDLCPSRPTCPHGDAVWGEFDGDGKGWADVVKLGRGLEAKAPADDLWDFLARACRAGAGRVRPAKGATPPGAEWCYLVHIWHTKYGRTPKTPLTSVQADRLTLHLRRTGP